MKRCFPAASTESSSGTRFAPGERFKEGEPLLELDRQERENQFKRAAAALKEGRGNLDFARKQLEDFSVLFKESLQSELEVKRKELELQIAESRFDTAEAERDNAALQLTYCTLKAPFAGRVEKILTREFETVRNGQPILSIIDDNRLLAVLHLPSADLPKIGLGDPVRLRINETAPSPPASSTKSRHGPTIAVKPLKSRR